MRITIKELAKITNLSVATISRYFNQPETVKEKTRQRISLAVEEYNYRPNEIARSLITNTSQMVGVILPDINNTYYPPVLSGIERALSKYGFSAFVCNTYNDIEREKNYIDTLLDKCVCGFIFIGTRPVNPEQNAHITKLSQSIPTVIINDKLAGEYLNYIMTDETKGMEEAVEYLVGLGHRKIAFINGVDLVTTYFYKESGYRNAMKKHQLKIMEDYCLKVSPYESGGYEGMCRLLNLSDPPTAVVTASDQIAIGAVCAIYENGLKVPEDVSVIGYANSPISQDVYPRLTTIDQYPYDSGYKAGEILVARVKKQGEVQKIVRETRLLVRNTCMPI